MSNSKTIAALDATSPLKPHTIQRREPGPQDVEIAIQFCGICHSDIHTARSEWGPTIYPCVPGHEIVGTVTRVGKKVKRFRKGDLAGVGCFVDSCGKCEPCKSHEEFYCEKGAPFTYNSHELDKKTPTYGGYAQSIVVREPYVLKIKKGQPLARVAPLLCAGITTYSPLKRAGVKKGQRLGVVGLGGLGHMAVKIGKAMGAEVTVFSTSESKRADAKKLGAKHFIVTKDLAQNPAALEGVKPFDVILDTVSAAHALSPYLGLLKTGGSMIIVGVPTEPHQIGALDLIWGRKHLVGSLIGGIKETQEMLDFCAKKKVLSDIELIGADKVNEAYDRTVRGDVKFRFVLDTSTL